MLVTAALVDVVLVGLQGSDCRSQWHGLVRVKKKVRNRTKPCVFSHTVLPAEDVWNLVSATGAG